MSKITNRLAGLLLSAALSFSILYSLTASFDFRLSPFTVLFMVAAALLLFTLIFINRLVFTVTAVSFAVFLPAAAILTGLSNLQKLEESFLDFIFWVIDYVNQAAPHNMKYEYILTTMICFIVTLFVFLFTCKKFIFPVILAGSTLVFVSQWTLDVFVSHFSFYIYISCIILYYFMHIYSRKAVENPASYASSSFYLLWSIPLAVIVVIAIASFPASSKPVEWKWMDSKVSSVFNYYSNFGYKSFDFFSVSKAGFGGRNGTLGGKVRLDNSLVLKVDAPRSVYLKAACMDYYTGTSWANTEDAFENLSKEDNRLYSDYIEMDQGMKLLGKVTGSDVDKDTNDQNENANDLNKDTNDRNKDDIDPDNDTIKIKYNNLRTRSLFIPVKTSSISFRTKYPSSFKVSPDGIVMSDDYLDKNFSYEVEVSTPKINSSVFKDMIKNSRKGLYAEAMLDDNLRKQIPALAAMADNADRVYAKYLQLPSTLPERVKDLADKITAAKKSNYAKVKAIEQYLSTNYPYTLTPRGTPRKSDFVDYFLFELKEGYCTYYAASMTVLVRCLGIPARYVEGYMLPPAPVSGTKTYHVTNRQAHAWVEVYFEGFGWLPFEPTSPFRSSFYSDTSYKGTISSNMAENPFMSGYMEWSTDFGRMETKRNTNINTDGSDSGDKAGIFRFTAAHILISLGVIFMLLLIVILSNTLRICFIKKSYQRLNPSKCIIDIYCYYLSILALQKLAINLGETPIQYAERIDKKLLLSPVNFKEITYLYLPVRYGNAETDESSRVKMLEFRRILLNGIRDHTGVIKYMIQKYILGKL